MAFQFGNEENENSKKIQELKDENTMLRSVVKGSISSMKDFKKHVEEKFTVLQTRHQAEMEETRKAIKVLLKENSTAFKIMEERFKNKNVGLEKEVKMLVTKVRNLEEYVARLEVDKEKDKRKKLDEEQEMLRKLLDYRNLTKILNERQFEALQKDCGFCGLEWERIYRGTDDGFGAQKFHSMCDSKSGTLVIVQSNTGNIFGGFNPNTWNINNGYYNSTGSWLFGFQTGNVLRKFHYNGNGYGIMCNNGYGPTFGGNHDLYISSNCEKNYTSYTNVTGRGSSSYNNSMGAPYYLNRGVRNFQVREIEVFRKKI